MSSEYGWIDDVLNAIKRDEAEQAAKTQRLAEHGNWLNLALHRMDKLLKHFEANAFYNGAEFEQDLDTARRMVKWAKEQGLL
jgi:hypothetical protein